MARDDVGGWPLLGPIDGQLVAQEALLRAAVGERAAGRALLERAESEAATSVAVANAIARLRLLEGDPDAARDALAPHLAPGAEPPTPAMPLSVRAEAWLLDALALDALAEHDDAARSLERSLDLAEPAGLRRLILEHGTLVGRCCAASAPRHSPPGDGRRDARQHRAPESRATRPVALMLTEPLSEREQAILRYLPTMMSNQEIAGELFVSVNTVKTHLKAIYRKLDATGRREAVQRGRDARRSCHEVSGCSRAAGAPRSSSRPSACRRRRSPCSSA